MNRRLWLAALLGALCLASVGAILVTRLTGTDVQAEINLVLQFVGIVSALAGVVATVLAIQHRPSREFDRQPQSRPTPPVHDHRAEALDRDDSLIIYAKQMRERLLDLGADPARFVNLSAAAERLLPRLQLLRRGQDQRLLSAEPEPIELFGIHTEFPRAVLLGEPGSGKSTCLLQLALRQLDRIDPELLGAERPPQAGPPRLGELRPSAEPPAPGDEGEALIPFYVPLSDWKDAQLDAAEFLERELADLVGPANYYVVNFDTLLAKGQFLLLLDGLNELPGRRASAREGSHEIGTSENPIEAMRQRLGRIDAREDSVRELASKTGLRSRFILSCRSHEYFDSMQWQVVRVLPMTAAQIEQFVRAYLEPPEDGLVLDGLSRNPDLAEIAANPFFLSRIIEFPSRDLLDLSRRGEVLRYLYRKLLEREDERGRPSPAEAEITKAIGPVAYRMLRDGVIGNRTPLPLEPKQSEAATALTATGLLVSRDEGFFFYHQIVQEFFSAEALKSRFVRVRPARLLADKRWSQVIALWYDLDPQAMSRRMEAALRAHNLPWRRPQAAGSVGLIVYALLTSIASIILVWTYLFDWLLWPAKALTSPFARLLFSPLALLAIAIGGRLVWTALVRHRKVIANSAYVLALGKEVRALPAIVVAFGRVWQVERADMAQSVGRFGKPATPHIVHGLESKRWRVRAGCVSALGEIARQEDPSDPAVVEPLLAAVASGDQYIVRSTIEALRHCRDHRVSAAITAALEQVVKWNPLVAQFRIPPTTEHWDPAHGIRWGDEAVARLRELTAASQPSQLRIVTLRVLGALRVSGCEEWLGELATNDDELIRQEAVRSLGLIQTPDAVERLVEVAERRAPTNNPAAQALAAVYSQSALPALERARTSERWWVRLAVASALGRVGGPEVLEGLRSLVADGDEDVRASAAKALGTTKLRDALPLLVALTRDEQRVARTAALEAITDRFPAQAADVLTELAADGLYPERLRVVELLARVPGSQAEAKLKALTGDPSVDVRRIAEESLETRSMEARARPSRPRRRGPVAAIRFVLRHKLRIDEIRGMMRDERLEGTPNTMVLTSIQTKVQSDAELSRKYRLPFRLITIATVAGSALAIGFVVLALRLALWSLGGIVTWWRPLGVVVLVAALTYAPGVRRLRSVSFIGGIVVLLRAAVGTILGIAIVGGFLYTWWIWLFLLITVLLCWAAVDLRARAKGADFMAKALAQRVGAAERAGSDG